ncbi:hypothetical protein [Paraburkholderia humisilvae]|uniref:Uncharacterized protein n=1 Tax=Paraburkholderia humisilvae TaxID=627669 RepID=A0A6J5CVW6_9BURK|nr:hypothetical protein [Paraburkholderia humisilvae]CAB3746109.1 hypothetical protein LMG29542_00126 [Paraburkholderia humisilvae]
MKAETWIAMSIKKKFVLSLLLTAVMLAGIFFGGCSNLPIHIELSDSIKTFVAVTYPFLVAASFLTTLFLYFSVFKKISRTGPITISAKNLYIFLIGLVAYLFALAVLASKFCQSW